MTSTLEETVINFNRKHQSKDVSADYWEGFENNPEYAVINVDGGESFIFANTATDFLEIAEDVIEYVNSKS